MRNLTLSRRQSWTTFFGPLDSVVDRFAKELAQERIENGHINVRDMNFAEMEMLSHPIGRPVAPTTAPSNDEPIERIVCG